MERTNLSVELDYDASSPASLRQAIERIKAEHALSETAAYAMLIRARLMAPAATPEPQRSCDPQQAAGRDRQAASPRLPRQRTPLAG